MNWANVVPTPMQFLTEITNNETILKLRAQFRTPHLLLTFETFSTVPALGNEDLL